MALTADALLRRVDFAYGINAERHWSHPFMHLTVRHSDFTDTDDDAATQRFAERLQFDVAEIEAVAQRTFIRFHLLGPNESAPPFPQRGTGWIDLLDPSFSRRGKITSNGSEEPQFLHFYGYKGGQGRSTSLALVALALANDGWRVLAVDFDAEAPSLDVIFGAPTNDIAATVLGLRTGEQEIRPVGIGQTVRRGEVALMPFRPEADSFDLDAAALGFELQGYPLGVEKMCESLRTIAGQFDITLVDHRTGLGGLVPLLVNELPGPVIVFARLDGQSRGGRHSTGALWSLARTNPPGALVSLAAPDESDEEFRVRTRPEAEELLQLLADAYGLTEDEEPRGADEFLDHWFVSSFENSLARSCQIQHTSLSNPIFVGGHLDQLRRLFGIHRTKQSVALEPSGARDQGDLIITQALRHLKTPNNPYSIIVGRKGTGKTRLVRELAVRRMGSPLLVPSDFSEPHGIRAGALGLKTLIVSFRDAPELLWIAILTAALELGSTEQEPLLRHATDLGTDEANLYKRLAHAAYLARSKSIFLIDALESAFDPKATRRFVGGLFRVLEMIDSTPELSASIQLRIFVRKDLVDKGIQNREQLESGRRIDLSWDLQTIFNFALSRIASIDWYREQFPKMTQQIEEQMPRIREGQLSAADCEDILLEAFPEKLRYKNIYTSTFLKTYFSDDSRGEAVFYPRVYVFFFAKLKELHQQGAASRTLCLDGTLIVKAHEIASQEFLQEVRQELAHAAGIKGTGDIDIVFEKLEGKQTPFDYDKLVKSVAAASKLKKERVQQILNAMKQLGIFEDYPKRPNQWRSGRLFKTALRMRFPSGVR